MQSTQGTPLDHLALVDLACIPVLHEKDSSGQTTTHQGTDSRLKPLSTVKKAYLLILELQPGCRFQACQTSRGYRDALREHEEGDTIFVLFPGLTISMMSPRKIIYLSSPILFCNSHLGDISRSSGLETNRVYDCSPKRLYIFAYVKSSCLRFWLAISLKLGAK